jgi:hypothetical protein
MPLRAASVRGQTYQPTVIDFHARCPGNLPGVIVRIGDVAPKAAMLRNIGCSEDCSARGDQFLHRHFDTVLSKTLCAREKAPGLASGSCRLPAQT